MDFKVRLTDEAIGDLAGIVSYIARERAEAAAYVGNEILATAESLALVPHRGPLVVRFVHASITTGLDGFCLPLVESNQADYRACSAGFGMTHAEFAGRCDQRLD
jgi:hypothetical protein